MILDIQEQKIPEKIQKIFSSLGEIFVKCTEYGNTIFFNYYLGKKENYTNHIGGFSMEVVDGGRNLFFGFVNLDSEYRGKGYGVKLHKLRLDMSKECHAESVIATSRMDNHTQNKIFEKFGWNRGELNENHYIWYKDIQKYIPKNKLG